MSKLNYKKLLNDEYLYSDYDSVFLESDTYDLNSMYDDEDLKEDFITLRSHIVDINSANITKSITGNDNDYRFVMRKAKNLLSTFSSLNDVGMKQVLELFSDCVFGYYVLSPLLKAADVSDIKVYSWDKITCKSNGRRYVTNLSFSSEEDYNRWFERIVRIHKLSLTEDNALQRCTDINGCKDFILRIDVQLKNIVSTQKNNIHIRKIPRVKYTWDYLIEAKMLDLDMIDYLKDRIACGYGFLISGKGGSGKSTLLNNMIDLIPYYESGLVIQESDELYSSHPQFQFEHTLEIHRNGADVYYSLEDGLRLGLLQDIDNFVIGEIKGGEALYCFTTAMSTGARFFGTIHANNAKDSTRRLAQCAKYISDYSVESLKEMLTATPFSLIHMSNFGIDEIIEISGWDSEKKDLEYDVVYLKNGLGAIVGYEERKKKIEEKRRKISSQKRKIERKISS